MLDVTEGHFQGLLARLDTLSEPRLDGLSPLAAFQRLDAALYLDAGQSSEQVVADAQRFFKFDFLTNGGESFDRTKSFVVPIGEDVRLLFRDEIDQFHTADVPRPVFVSVIQSFLDWIRAQAVRAS